MRDPLHWLDVKRKLALTFACVCLLAFGVGGSLAATSASTALESEIHVRLRSQCRVWTGALDADLRLLTRRVEDFASDGYIRERSAAAIDGAADGARGDLMRHLAANKLPLVAEFVELAVLDPSSRVVTTATGAPAPHEAALPDLLRTADGVPWHSGLLAPEPAAGAAAPPLQAIAVPLRSLDGTRRLGRLVAWIRTDRWLGSAFRGLEDAGPRPGERVDLALSDASGMQVHVPAALIGVQGTGVAGDGALAIRPGTSASGDAAAPHRGDIALRLPLATNGWTASVRFRSPDSLAPVAGLQSRFLLVGVALALTIGALLLFPMRFLARPLVELRQAARRLEDGELSVRVATDTGDEIGDLARSFNHMADAVATRTRRLEEAAAELAAQRDRLDGVIASMRDGLVVLDADGRPVLTNAAARPLADLVAARDSRVASHYRCDDSKRLACVACLADPRREPRTCVVDAGGRSYEVRGTPLPPGPDGRRGRVLVARDVTDRVQQDEREIHHERLSVLGEVAAVMAHELNNPLAAISLFSQMAEKELPEGAPLREHLGVIRRNTESCKRAIRELLDYATGAAPQFGEVDVHEVLRDVARFLRPLAERSGCAIALDLRAERPEIPGDEIQVRQVFVNLVVNALQAAGGDGGRVRLTTYDDDGHVAVDVEDTGPGVPDDVRPRIFDAFFTTKGRGVGTGLGLPTARRIAELHGGGVELVASRPGRTVFRVRLRARAPQGAAT